MVRSNTSCRAFLAVLLAAFGTQSRAFQGANPGLENAASTPAGAIIEQLAVSVAFSSDGTSQTEETVKVRIQSDADVREYGVLTMPYMGGSERAEIHIRVTKPNGSIIETPGSDAQDLPSAVTREAPTYSDSREKQVPVKGLGVGDLLEWHTQISRTAAEIPGQFWFTYSFPKTAIAREETLKIAVPAGKYVKVGSPGLQPEVTTANGQVTYFWKSSRTEVSKVSEKRIPPRLQPLPEIQITTFRTWEEVGQWYGALAKPKIQVTPEIQAQAMQLTRGLATDTEKERAIYQFVSSKFRYIAVNFGAGRFQPHSAAEVLANQYGDCKDKHTLLAALMKAAGIEAWPALIGAGLSFDPGVPSPAQFNHLITYLPGSGKALWLDATPEAVPFQMLTAVLRGHKALVIPDSGAASVMTTPEDLPFAADEGMNVTGKLDSKGTLTAHFEWSFRGDSELAMRSAFRAAGPAKWTELVQSILPSLGFGGAASNVSVDNPTNTDGPFHFAYDYKRESYSDWANLRITPPFGGFGFEGTAELDPPVEPPFLGALGAASFHASIELPEGYSIRVPAGAHAQTDFAGYESAYAVEKGVLSVTRTFSIKKAFLPVGDWAEYQELAKSAATDESQLLQLMRTSNTTGAAGASPETLNSTVATLLQRRDYAGTIDYLSRLEQSNPRQERLWANYGELYLAQGQQQKAIEAFQKEIDLYPGTVTNYTRLSIAQRQLGRVDDEVATLKRALVVAPKDVAVMLGIGEAFGRAKRYAEGIESINSSLEVLPANVRLEGDLLRLQLSAGNQTEAREVLTKLRTRNLDQNTANTVAYGLAEANFELAIAQEIGAKAVASLEEQTGKTSLEALTATDLRRAATLSVYWDTMGWVYFRSSDFTRAEKYLRAAWSLQQSPTISDHLGQLYEKEGRKAQAIRAYQLALAVEKNLPETRDRLAKLGQATEAAPAARGRAANASIAELSRDRSIPVPGISHPAGTAEVFLLLSPAGVVATRFIEGDEKLKDVLAALSKMAVLDSTIPDSGPERVARRGILSCTQYATPNCMLILTLAADAQP